MNGRKLYRTEGSYKSLCGVCGGLGEYFEIDATMIRVGWAIASFCTFSMAFWFYLICAFIIPRKSDIYPGY